HAWPFTSPLIPRSRIIPFTLPSIPPGGPRGIPDQANSNTCASREEEPERFSARVSAGQEIQPGKEQRGRVGGEERGREDTGVRGGVRAGAEPPIPNVFLPLRLQGRSPARPSTASA